MFQSGYKKGKMPHKKTMQLSAQLETACSAKEVVKCKEWKRVRKITSRFYKKVAVFHLQCSRCFLQLYLQSSWSFILQQHFRRCNFYQNWSPPDVSWTVSACHIARIATPTKRDIQLSSLFPSTQSQCLSFPLMTYKKGSSLFPSTSALPQVCTTFME